MCKWCEGTWKKRGGLGLAVQLEVSYGPLWALSPRTPDRSFKKNRKKERERRKERKEKQKKNKKSSSAAMSLLYLVGLSVPYFLFSPPLFCTAVPCQNPLFNTILLSPYNSSIMFL